MPNWTKLKDLGFYSAGDWELLNRVELEDGQDLYCNQIPTISTYMGEMF